MDIYPTLISLCGLSAKQGLEGNDIKPLLKDPVLPWDHPSITTFGKNNHAVRTERWRYIHYSDNTEELYDHDADPYEWKNLAPDPKYTEIKKELAVWLPTINVNAAGAESAPRRPQNLRDSTVLRQ